MEVIVVLAVAGALLAVVVVGLGSMFGRSRMTDELQAERGAHGADESPRSGMGSEPLRDRPAGPGAEPQDPDNAVGEMHPREQRGESADEAALPSEAAGKHDPKADDER